MKRRYLIILGVALVTTAFGQNPRLKQLEDCLHKQGYVINYSQMNMSSGRGITRDWAFALDSRGQEIINRFYYRTPDSIVALRRQQLAIAFDSIRTAFTDLSKETRRLCGYHRIFRRIL